MSLNYEKDDRKHGEGTMKHADGCLLLSASLERSDAAR
jgi:hypothetical protein